MTGATIDPWIKWEKINYVINCIVDESSNLKAVFNVILNVKISRGKFNVTTGLWTIIEIKSFTKFNLIIKNSSNKLKKKVYCIRWKT